MSSKGEAYLFLNNKYELVFNINNNNNTLFKNKRNETVLVKGIKIPNYIYLFYKIEINNNFTLLLKNGNSIVKKSENFWDYKKRN